MVSLTLRMGEPVCGIYGRRLPDGSRAIRIGLDSDVDSIGDVTEIEERLVGLAEGVFVWSVVICGLIAKPM